MAVQRYVMSTIWRLYPGDGEEYPWMVDVIYFIDVPDTNNMAGVSYRVAAKDEQWSEETGKVVPLVPDLETKYPTIYAALQAGEKYQYRETFTFSSLFLNDAQRDAELDARQTELATDGLIETKKKEWRYWGNVDTVQ